MNPPLNGSSAVWLVLIRCNLHSLGFQLSTFCAGWCSSALISFLSLQGFQLPTFCAGWCSSVISSFSLLRGFNCQPFVLVGAHLLYLLSLSSGVSTAKLSCWLVLIRYIFFLFPWGATANLSWWLVLICCNLSLS